MNDDTAPKTPPSPEAAPEPPTLPAPPSIPLEWHPTDPTYAQSPQTAPISAPVAPPAPQAPSDTEQRLRALAAHYAPAGTDIDAEAQWVMQGAEGYQYRPPLQPIAPAPQRALPAAQPAAPPQGPALPTAEQLRKMTDREFEAWDAAYFRPMEAAQARRGHRDPAPTSTAYL